MTTARNQQSQRAILLLTIGAALCFILAGKTALATEQIDQSNLPAWAGGWTHINPTSEGKAVMWQTFTPSCPNLTAVEIDIINRNPGQGGEILIVEIAKENDILATVDCYVEDGFNGLMRFEFPKIVNLIPGQIYKLTVRDTGMGRFGWRYASNTYKRGSRYTFAQEYPDSDWFFQTYSKIESKYSGGTGEPNNPYKIATAEDLIALGNEPNDYDNHFILINDIDLAGYFFDRAVIAPDTDPNDEIGYFQGTSFTGVIDGNDHTISHLTIRGVGYLGLFGRLGSWDLSGGEVKNLGVVDVNVIGSGGSVGGMVGFNGGAVTQCYSRGEVRSTGSGLFSMFFNPECVGGLMGHNGGYVAQCYSACAVDGNNAVGGLVGSNSGTVTQCCSTATVDGNEAVGGLVGHTWGVASDNVYISTIDNCYSLGRVSGRASVGGLIGTASATEQCEYCESWYCYCSCLWPSIINCYAAGSVSGNSHTGGLIGEWNLDCDPSAYEASENNVIRCFWDTKTSGQVTSDGGTGKTTAEMKTKSTFTSSGWDFVGETVNGPNDIWSICEGTNYPRLVWQIPAGDFVCPDGITMEEDFDFFMDHWENSNCDSSNGYCDGTDLDLSGTVDIDDFKILINQWLEEISG